MAEDNKPPQEPKYLGKVNNEPTDKLDCIPWPAVDVVTVPTIKLSCSEFTSFCPVTNQPDFGKLQILYQPNMWLVETKSMKLFLFYFRNQRGFNEALTTMIAHRFFEQVKPFWCRVVSEFNPRGGISVTTDLELGTYKRHGEKDWAQLMGLKTKKEAESK